MIIDLCSLRSNVERFAFSVVWELTPDAEEVSVEFFKSIIKSRHSFTYAEAQLRIDDRYDGRLPADVSTTCNLMSDMMMGWVARLMTRLLLGCER